jgi:uncharacterized membrane protein
MVTNGFETLRALRAPEHLPPSKVDILRALADGRRRERNRRVLAVTAVAVAVGATLAGVSAFAAQRGGGPIPADETPTPPAPARNGCTVQRLATPGDRPASVSAVDPGGTTIAGNLDETAAGKADDWLLLWTDGRVRLLDDAPQPHPRAAGLLGQTIVGNSGGGPWLFTDGRFTPLARPPLPGATVTVVGLNATGDIVGNAVSPAESRIVTWTVAHPERFGYLSLTGTQGISAGIADDGTVYGRLADGRAYLWPRDGAASELPPPGSNATASAGDWFVGTAEGDVRGWRWNNRSSAGQDLGTFVPGAVDETGRMFGTDVRSPVGPPPLMWRDGTTLELPVLATGQSASIAGASRDGRVVGGRLQALTPVRWSCGP